MKYFEKNKLTLRTLLLILVLSLSLTGCQIPVPPTVGEEPTQENVPTQEDTIISSGDIAAPIWMMAYVPNQYLDYDTDLDVILLYHPLVNSESSGMKDSILNMTYEITMVAYDDEGEYLEETTTFVTRIENATKDMYRSITINGYTYCRMVEEIVVPKEMLVCPNGAIVFIVDAYYTIRVRQEEKIITQKDRSGACVYYRKLEQNIRLFGSRWDFDEYEEEK